MVVQVMLRLVVGRRQRIYCERFSLMLESEVGLEESAAGGTLCLYSQALLARIAYCPAPGSTSPSATFCAAATKGRRQTLVAVEGEEDFQGTVGVCPPCPATWSAPWEAGEVVKVSVYPIRSGNRRGQIQASEYRLVVPSCLPIS